MKAFVSARQGASLAQKITFLAFVIAIVAMGEMTIGTLGSAALLLSPVYLTHVLFTLGAALERPVPPQEMPPQAVASDSGADDLPSYTVLVPLYREARVAAQLVGTLRQLDYPAGRLQVLFLLEVDDIATRRALEQAAFPRHMTILTVPPGEPRTKPRALNHGLAAATGALITVFDAEDLPDADQLRRAAVMFARLPQSTACLQARLVIDNAPDGWLALMMSLEYAGLFDATKCGLAAMELPVALGGTSNHFRADVLRAVGGWDSWNVTEDAELGLRLAGAGYLVADLPSMTLEEAPYRLDSWFMQRRRWHKGFMQTLVSHSHTPLSDIRRQGLFDWAGGLIQIAGTVIGALLFPFFTLLVVWHAATGALFDNGNWQSAVLNTLALWVVCCGLMTAFVPTVIGLKRRRIWQLAPWLLTLPVYLMLISAAAWVAVVDYWREPYRWLKTEHGLSVRRPEAFRSRRGTRP